MRKILLTVLFLAFLSASLYAQIQYPYVVPGTAGHCGVYATDGTQITDAGSPCGSGSGSVTSFSSGNLSPLFATSVATATTTPALTFSLSNAAANTLLGNFTGSSAGPSYNALPSCSASGSLLQYTSGTGFTCGTGYQTALTFTSPLVNTSGTVACATCVVATVNPTAGLLRVAGSTQTATGAELSGDCTTSGSNALTCLKTNGTAFGTAATQNTGTSGANVPLLNGANTYSGASTFSAAVTNSTASAASAPAETLTGALYSGGTGTQTQPHFYLNPGNNTAPSTWNTSGTLLGMNAPNSFGGNFLDLHTNGGTSVFLVSAAGSITMSGGAVTTGGPILGSGYRLTSGHYIVLSTAPTIASGFGSTPSVADSNGTAAFAVNVGTGGSASSGVVTMPAATTAWNCYVNDITCRNSGSCVSQTYQTARSTTSVTVTNQLLATGAATAWTASDIVTFVCMGD